MKRSPSTRKYKTDRLQKARFWFGGKPLTDEGYPSATKLAILQWCPSMWLGYRGGNDCNNRFIAIKPMKKDTISNSADCRVLCVVLRTVPFFLWRERPFLARSPSPDQNRSNNNTIDSADTGTEQAIPDLFANTVFATATMERPNHQRHHQRHCCWTRRAKAKAEIYWQTGTNNKTGRDKQPTRQ